jgi:hypothetical protein
MDYISPIAAVSVTNYDFIRTSADTAVNGKHIKCLLVQAATNQYFRQDAGITTPVLTALPISHRADPDTGQASMAKTWLGGVNGLTPTTLQ